MRCMNIEQLYTIGKGKNCDIVLKNDIYINKLHATIKKDAENKFIIKDLNSVNGLFIMQNGLAKEISEDKINSNSIIRLGKTKIKIFNLISMLNKNSFSVATTTHVQGENLIQCPSCGAPKNKNKTCEVCGE